jgi:hypothetical protein
MRDLERDATGVDGVRKEVELLRGLTPEERILMAFRLRRVVLDLSRAGIRHQHPDFSEDEIELEVQRRILPPKLFDRLCQR